MTNTTRAFWNSTVLLSALAAGVASQTNEAPHVAKPDHIAPESKMVAAASTEIEWLNDLEAAIAESERTGKALWLHFMHDGCAPCARLKKEFAEPRIVEFANEHFIACEVNRSRSSGSAIARNYGMANVGDPCDVFVYPGHPPLRYDKPLTEPTANYLLGRFKGVIEHKPEAQK